MDPKIQKLLYAFFKKFGQKSFLKEETILKPTDKKIFFLTNGAVGMFSVSGENSQITLNIYKQHSIFPMPLVFDLENKYTFDSITRVEGYFAPKKDFKMFLNKNPDILFDLVKRIYLGFDGFFTQLEALLLGDAFCRVTTSIIIYTRRFGQKNDSIITFDWQLTHKQIASQTGLARESVTKEIKKLQEKGLIGYSGKKLFIYDLGKLEEEYFSYLSKIQKLPLDKH